MRKFGALLKVSFWGMLYAMNLAGGNRKRRISGAGVLALAGGLMLMLSATYSFSFSTMLAQQGMVDMLPMLMSLLAVILCAAFSLFGAQGILFSTRDMDLALSWPVSPLQLVLSRVLALYLENLFLLGVWMLPVWLAWMLQGGCTPAAFIALPISVLLLAFLPCVLAMAAGFVLALISARFSHKALINNLLYLLLLAGIFAGSFSLQGQMFQMQSAFFTPWPMRPFLWFTEALRLQDASLAALAAVCFLPFLLIAWLISRQYAAILTLLASHRARFDYRLTRQHSSGHMRALIGREFRRYFGISIYLFNTGIGLLLLAIGAVAAVLQKDQLQLLMAQLGSESMPMTAVLALTVGFILAMTQPTSCSISLEGEQLWILKSAPLRPWELFGSKIGMQLILVLPFLVVCVPVMGWALGVTTAQAVALLVAAVAMAFCVAPMGLVVNLHLPKLDAPNPTVVVKQSAATLVGLLAGFALMLPGALLFKLIPQVWNGCGWLAVAAVLYLTVGILLWRFLLTRGAAMLEEL